MKGLYKWRAGGCTLLLTTVVFGTNYGIKKRRTSGLFSLLLELCSSSFRSTKLFVQVFHIITIKDTNLEDLFKGCISVFTTVGF